MSLKCLNPDLTTVMPGWSRPVGDRGELESTRYLGVVAGESAVQIEVRPRWRRQVRRRSKGAAPLDRCVERVPTGQVSNPTFGPGWELSAVVGEGRR